MVRYFGGIKLGIPGLIRAYKTSSRDAIDSAEIVEKTASRRFHLAFDYISVNDVMKAVKDMSLRVLSQTFDVSCSMEVSVRLSAEEDFRDRISRIEGCKIEAADE